MTRALALSLLIGCAPQTAPGAGSSAVLPGTPSGPGGGGAGATGGGTGSSGSSGSSGATGGCPEGVICVDALPFTDVNTTVGMPAELDAYGCDAGIDESGPEVLYRVTLSEPGLLVASLSGLPAGVDVDVHLLEQADPATCIDRGHWDAASLLEPGTYWVAVDSWVDGSGDALAGEYTLDLALNRSADHAGAGLSEGVWGTALRAFDRAWADRISSRLEYTVVDYTLPSTEPRMFVVDLRHADLAFAELAAHGSGSQDPNDLTMAANLSNVEGSNASSFGLVLTAETYWGSNGYSMRMDGLEAGYADNDRTRAIVIHGADYATQDFVDDYGYLGRSWGCPAIDPAVNDALIDTISDGALLLKYWDDPTWLATSHYVAP